MDEAIEMLDKFDVPLQNMLASEGVTNIRNDWLDDDLDAQTVTLTAAFTAAGTTLTVADSSNIRVRDLVQRLVPVADVGTALSQQILEVTAVPTATTITVPATTWGGTSAQSYSSGEVLQIIGQVPQEGADPQASRDGDPSGRFNYTQIFQEKVDATRTAQKNDQYGIDDPKERMKQRKFKELAIRYERALVHSVRFLSADKKQRTLGGLLFQITTNVLSNTKANIKTLLNDSLVASYNLGASPNLLVVSPAVKIALSNMDSTLVTVARDDQGAGQVKSYFESDFGRLEFLTDRHFPRGKGIALERQYVMRQNFDDWFYEDLAKTGDSEQGEVVGEFSLKVKNEKAHSVVTVTDA
jgi:hypothetical protein